MMEADYYIGLMSGTSLDGIDAALVSFQPRPSLLATHYCSFDAPLKSELLALHKPGPSELDRAARVSLQLSIEYAKAVNSLLDKAGVPAATIKAVGCHGQTIRHQPALGYTIQLNQPAYLAESTGITVVADFRSRDIAAGGQGAPLVPAFHQSVFQQAGTSRAIVNIGGIANLTWLPDASRNNSTPVGFDTGPGNLLMDAWAAAHTGQAYDAGGRMGASGKVITDILVRMMADPYFGAAPPKSTGRDHFNMDWLQRHGLAKGASEDRPEDIQATLAELTAGTITASVQQWCPGVDGIYVCGGGAHNSHLMECLQARLAPVPVTSTTALGVDPDWVEAMAFAWLARQCLQGKPGNLPAVTGASGPRILGAIYPA